MDQVNVYGALGIATNGVPLFQNSTRCTGPSASLAVALKEIDVPMMNS